MPTWSGHYTVVLSDGSHDGPITVEGTTAAQAMATATAEAVDATRAALATPGEPATYSEVFEVSVTLSMEGR